MTLHAASVNLFVDFTRRLHLPSDLFSQPILTLEVARASRHHALESGAGRYACGGDGVMVVVVMVSYMVMASHIM